jgi:transcriptional regulator with XRE-family HTH domain
MAGGKSSRKPDKPTDKPGRQGASPRLAYDSVGFSDRLKAAIGSRTAAEVARSVGIAPQTLDAYLKGAVPSADRAFTLADVLGVRVSWLIRGDGPRTTNPEFVEEDDWIWLPHYDLFSFEGASHGAVLERVPVRLDWLMARAKTRVGAWVTEMPTDAMPDVAPRGDMIVCKPPEAQLQDRRIYALQLDGRPIIRTVEVTANGLVLSAQNPAIEPIVPSAEQLEQLVPLGRVVGAIKLLAI